MLVANPPIPQTSEALLDRISQLETRLKTLEEKQPADRLSLIVSSNDFDRLMPAFILATGAASMGMEAHLFHTFWGITALKKKPLYEGKNIMERMLTVMLPSNVGDVNLTKMNMMGAGIAMFKMLMKKHNISTLPELLALSQQLGVKMIACQMTMGLMGITREELIDGIEFGGVAMYLESASNSRVTLFL